MRLEPVCGLTANQRSWPCCPCWLCCIVRSDRTRRRQARGTTGTRTRAPVPAAFHFYLIFLCRENFTYGHGKRCCSVQQLVTRPIAASGEQTACCLGNHCRHSNIDLICILRSKSRFVYCAQTLEMTCWNHASSNTWNNKLVTATQTLLKNGQEHNTIYFRGGIDLHIRSKRFIRRESLARVLVFRSPLLLQVGVSALPWAIVSRTEQF